MSATPLLAALALIVAAAKIGGWLSNRLGQPAVLGELLAGLLLGPSVLDVFGHEYFEAAHTGETLRELGELGVIFLMFAAGLEIHLSDFARAGKTATLTGIAGVLVPLLLGAAIALPFGYAPEQAIFLGIVLSATSVSISAQTLMELGRLRSPEGLTLLGAAVVDDVLAILVLSIFTALAAEGSGGTLAILWLIARMLLFLAGAMLLGRAVLPRLAATLERLPGSEPLMSLVVVSALAFAWASEAVGSIATITGAFIAGVAFASSSVKGEIQRGIHTLTYAFFVPVFLVGIGLAANVRDLSRGDLGLAVAVSLTAVLSKLIGAGGGARLAGMSWRQAVRVAAGMVSRGEVGLIVASVGTAAGILTQGGFTVAVVMVLVTTLIAPLLLRLAFQGKETGNGSARGSGA